MFDEYPDRIETTQYFLSVGKDMHFPRKSQIFALKNNDH